MPHIETEIHAAVGRCHVALPAMQRRPCGDEHHPGRVGRGGCEYWTMRCTRCGGIHLDIVEQGSGSQTA